MADPRTFVLIGNFEDNITPALTKINNAVDGFKRNMATLSTKKGGGYNDVTQAVGKLVSAQKHLKTAIEGVGAAAKAATGELKEYKSIMGKVASAQYHIQRSGTAAGKAQTKFWQGANKDLEEYKRNMEALQRQTRINPYRALSVPKERGRNRAYPTPLPQMETPRYERREREERYESKRGPVARDAVFAFGQTLGYQLSNTITGSIVQGFQIGVGLMVKPFQYFMDGFSERVKDESTDVQTAGAMFAIAQRKNMDMFQNFNQAIRAQQQINYKLAESAAALPGATTEYVQMGKRVLDSMMTVLSKDVKGVSAFAQELDPNLKEGDKQGALATLTQKFTEKAVLLGQGSTYRGNYGVPQLLEQLIGKEQVSENMFNKFAMYRDLPIFQSVFKDMEGELAKTGAYSAERIRLVFKLLDEALPNEVLQAHKNTMAGFLEAMKSAFLDPEVGLFGLGRKIQGMEMAMVDQYGNFINRQGQIVSSWDEAAKEQISLYESIQKILTGFGLPLSELATYLPQLFEPFAKLITPLESMFKVAQGFYRNFNLYTKEFEGLAKGLSDMGDKKGAATMKKSAGARGSLLAISNLLTAFGDMSEGKFKEISTKLQQPEADIGAIAKEVLNSVFNSKFIEELGFQIGMLVGGVLSTVGQLLGVTKGAADTRLVQGLKAGFEAAGGTQAFREIFTNLFQLIFKVVKRLFLMAPAQITAFLATALTVPALMAGISVAIGNIIENFVDNAIDSLLKGARNTKVDKVAEVVDEVAKAVSNIAEEAARPIRNARVTTGGKKIKNPVGTYVTESGGKGTSGRYVRSIREGTVTKSGRGITRSGDAVTGGAKVTQSYQKVVEAPKPKPDKLKNFLKGALGVDESIFGRPLVDLVKKLIPALKASLAKLVGAFGALTPILAGFGSFFGTLGDALSKVTVAGSQSPVKGAFGKLQGFLDAFEDVVGNLLDRIPGMKRLGDLLEADFDLKGIGATIKGRLSGLISLTQDFVWTLGDDVAAFLNKTGKSLKGGLTKIDDLLIDWISGTYSIGDDLSEWFGPAKKAIASVADDVLKAIGVFSTNLKGFLAKFTSLPTGQLTSVADDVLKAIGVFGTNLKGFLAKITSAPTGQLTSVADDVLKAIGVFSTNLKGFLAKFTSLPTGQLTSVADDVLKAIGVFSTNLKDFFGKSGKNLIGAFRQLDDVVLSWIEGSRNVGDDLLAILGPFKKAFGRVVNVVFDLIEGNLNITDDLVALLRPFKTAFTGLGAGLSAWVAGAVNIRQLLLASLQNAAKGFKTFSALPKGAAGGASVAQRLAGAAAGAKGLAVRIVGFGNKGVSNVKGGFARLFGGAKGAKEGSRALIRQRGLGGSLARGAAKMAPGRLLSKGVQGLGKFGGIATAGVGIIEAITSLLSGDSLGTALGKGAGPVLGTIIGTALLGPLGGFIGGWIGGMKPVTDTLSGLFEGLIWGFQMLGKTLGPALEAFGGVISSIVGVFIGMIPGMDNAASSLDLLNLAFIGAKLALFPFISAINAVAAVLLLLKIGILKLDKWINEKFQFGDRQGRLQNEIDKTWGQLGKVAETQKKINDDLLKPLADKNTKKEGYLTKNGVKGWQDAQGNWTAGGNPPVAPKSSTAPQAPSKPIYSTPGKPGFITVDGKTFWRGTDGTLTAVVGGVAPAGTPYRTQAERMLDEYKEKKGEKDDGSKEAAKTSQNTTDLNKKATDHLKRVGEVKTSTDKTTQAVNNLATKITPQTNLQTSVAAIYSLLASGQLRVVGSVGQKPNTTFIPTPGQTTYPGLTLPTPDNSVPGVRSWQNILGVPEANAKGALGDAIASEMKNKPSGSDLVIANSSETVIPAAGGHGMVDFVNTLKWGFATMISTFKQAQQKQDSLLGSINQTLKTNQQQTNVRLMAMEKKFATPGMPGGLGGGAAGGVDAFTPIAQRMGLQMTSGYRPGDPGWHGANRARDFSNGTGPTPQMMQFAQLLASNYGRNLKELIYTPLGFSIKNGQQVPPYAQGSHYNHVHVAYAGGLGNPILAPTRAMAEQIDARALGRANIKTYTAGKGEFGGGGIGTLNVTVNAGNISDPDTLADVVAQRILSEMQSTDSIFV